MPKPVGVQQDWTNTIFLQVADPAMEMVLEELANKSGCYCHIGDPCSPDIMAVPAFAAVLDRHVIGREQWQAYIGYREEVNSRDLCVVVDTLTDWEFPYEDLHMVRTRLQSPEDAKAIFELIRSNRMAYLNR